MQPRQQEMLWEMVSRAADMEEDEARMKAAAA